VIDLSRISLTDWTSPFPAASVPNASLGRVVSSQPGVIVYQSATMEWQSVPGEPVTAIKIRNTSTLPLIRWGVSLPLPPFAPGKLATNCSGYGTTRPEGWQCAAPCGTTPLRAWWFKDGAASLCIIPEPASANERWLLNYPKLADLIATGKLAPDARLTLWVDRVIAPGESTVVRFKYIDGTDQNTAGTIGRNLPGRPLRYQAWVEPVAQLDIADASKVTPANPLGFDEGCRLDLSNGHGWMNAQVDVCAAAGFRLMQFMGSQAGYRPPMVNPDMTGYEMDVYHYLMSLCDYCRVNNRRIGFGGRPGDKVKNGVIARATDRAVVVQEITDAIGCGATDFYWDSFGHVDGNVGGASAPAAPSDRDYGLAIRNALTRLGLGTPCMAELSTELTLDLFGVYLACQWNGSAFAFAGRDWRGERRGIIDLETWRIIRAVYPGVYGAAQVFAPEDRMEAAYEWCVSQRVVPMVQLYRVAKEGPRVAALIAGLTRDGQWV
jgi:hypothetical protein